MSFSDQFVRFFRNFLPSPFTLAVLLTVLTFFLGFWTVEVPSEGSRVMALFGHWSSGIWGLLEFAMQMMLMLVLGHVLALSPVVGRLIDGALYFCRDNATAAFTVTFVVVAVALFNWGLGLIVGAILARKVGEYASKNGIPLNYALIGAAGYSGLMVWHGGVSGSAPLKVAQSGHQFVEFTGGQAIDVGHTLGSPMNLTVSVALLLILPTAMFFLARKGSAQVPDLPLLQASGPEREPEPETPAERLDHSRWLSLAFGLAVLFLFVYELVIRTGSLDLGSVNPNLINLLLFGLCLCLHPHFSGFLQSTEQAIRGSTGIMIQFPLYAGIMGIMKGSGLAAEFSEFFVEVSNETTFPLYTLISAGVVNFFVPSGGGQWGVQGGIVLEAAQTLAENSEMARALTQEEVMELVRAAQSKSIMALSYGDQLTNMMQPFWALPLLGITGLKAGQILPYTLFLMVVGLSIFVAGLLIF